MLLRINIFREVSKLVVNRRERIRVLVNYAKTNLHFSSKNASALIGGTLRDWNHIFSRSNVSHLTSPLWFFELIRCNSSILSIIECAAFVNHNDKEKQRVHLAFAFLKAFRAIRPW